MPRGFPIVPIAVAILSIVFSQQTPQQQSPQQLSPQNDRSKEKQPEQVTHLNWTASAHSVYLKKTGGSDIPYDVISSDIEGWGRFVLVSSQEKADIVLEILSTDSGGVTTSVSTKTSGQTGQNEPSETSRRDISPSELRLVAYIAVDKNRMSLWQGSEHVKFAMKQVARENNLVDAAQRLFAKFHERIEPRPQRQEVQ
ncbi:MAG TPA: hypothetical protein VKZ53_20015 [Candidatus Angelobacter sp.]|nr:hypothetical protein [Candidatus Angelobacter sp.]